MCVWKGWVIVAWWGQEGEKRGGMHKIACAADLLQVRTHTGLARHKKAERESQKRKKEAAIELS